MTLKRPALVALLVIGLAVAGCDSTGPYVSSPTHRQSTGFTVGTPPSTTFATEPVPTQPPAIDLAGLVRVPDPLSGDNPRYPEQALSLPPVGTPFQDSGLGTSIVRVTDRPGIRHEYSRFDPFNADKSLIVLLDDGFMVFRTVLPYDRAENRVLSLDIEDPRWDRDDADVITGLSAFRILSIDVRTGRETTVKDFATDPTIGPLIAAEDDLYRVTMKNEGEVSLDGRWWALALQGTRDDYRLRYLFCWDRSTDQVAGLLELERSQADIDWVGMSPLGTWVLVGAEPGNGEPLRGFTIADRRLTEFHRIDHATAHSDVGLDTDGQEVLVMQNTQTDHIDMLPLATTTSAAEGEGGYLTSGHVPLVRLFYAGDSPIGLDSGVHISCNAAGYALISTHQEPGRPEQNWLDRSIVLVRLDPHTPETYLIAKIHNITREYWEETHATITNDGRTVLWAANFGIDPGAEKTYLLRLDLPRR